MMRRRSTLRFRIPVLLVLFVALVVPTAAIPAPAATPTYAPQVLETVLESPILLTSAEEVLLSQGKPATASSDEPTFLPSNGNDSDGDTSWRSNFEQNWPQWWQVDLEAVTTLTRVYIDAWDYAPECSSLFDYTVEISEDTLNWTTVATDIDANGGDYTLDAPARYLRVTFTRGYNSCNPEDLINYATVREIEVYGSGASLSLSITDAQDNTVSELTNANAQDSTGNPMTTNDDGWYAQNPLKMKVIATNLGSQTLQARLEIDVGAESNPTARFYMLASEDCTHGYNGAEFSWTFYHEACSFPLEPGESSTRFLDVMVQPAEAGVIDFVARLYDTDRIVGDYFALLDSDSESIQFPQAAIHPVVFLHGILGSMPPQDKLLETNDDVRAVLDPFLGSYWPLIDQLQKMGYELNRTLFPLAYD
ncbi:MAG: discoidin domain-containing protein [Chloroflexales bacterium]|nr:discoidin domain-containing protein [Chloroflexales bacterium]